MKPFGSAIVIGSDTPIGLTVIRELGQNNVPVIAVGSSNDSLGKASRWTKSFFERPGGQAIADWLPNLISQYNAAAVFAISENDLIELANLPAIIRGCKILTPREEPLSLVLNKNATFERAKKIGIDVPHTWQPALHENFVQIADTLSYPVAIKWADPMEAMCGLEKYNLKFEKIEYAQNSAELLKILNRYDAMKLWPMVQTWCPGKGIGQMFLMGETGTYLKFQHRRIHEWPPSGGVSSLCATEPFSEHTNQMRKSELLLRDLGWEGPAMVEYRYDASTGRYWLMEVNGRFWGSLPLAHYSGAHFAWEMYRTWILNQTPLEQTPSLKSTTACFFIPEAKRMMKLLKEGKNQSNNHKNEMDNYGSRTQIIIKFLMRLFNFRTRYYVWSIKDPLPFFADIKNITSGSWHKKNHASIGLPLTKPAANKRAYSQD
jgi:predicted ATP-grasp superfamily ATP-dependent carboligase